jgi:hypothetical protein
MKDFNFKYLFFAAKHKQDILFAQDILYAPTVYLVEVYPIEVYHIGKGAVEISGLPPLTILNLSI